MSTATAVAAPAQCSEKPIIFSGAMIRAIFDGAKTQTRRVVTPQPHLALDVGASGNGFVDRRTLENGDRQDQLRVCPYGTIGDRLWVKETWAAFKVPDVGTICAYRATCDDDELDVATKDGGVRRIRVELWRPSIYMSRALSRLTLEVTSVRVERLQDINDEDACAEGIERADREWYGGPHRVHGKGRKVFYSARQAYSDVWDFINGKRSPWVSNPWVWVVGFRRAPR